MYSDQQTNQLSGLQIFAVNKKWYDKYVIGDFESDIQIPQIDNYSLCICREEQTSIQELQNKIKKDFNINTKITINNIQEQVFKADKWQQTKFVSKEIWENLQKIYGGGPCIPLYTTTNSESSVARISFRELKFLTNNDVPELNEYLVIGINMIQMDFFIQNDDDTFTFLNKVVPSSFTIEQVIIKILTPLYDLSNYDYYVNYRKNIAKSTLIHELSSKSVCFVKSSLPDDFDEHLSRERETRNYPRDTTESTTESRDVQSSFFDITQQQQHEIEDIDNLMLRGLDEFKNEIDNILKHHKNLPLILLKPEQALENINQIIQQIEQDNCLKKEEEGTNDELIEQDI